MHTKRIKDIDDLDLIPCLSCSSRGGHRVATCPECPGTGDLVIHRTKYYTVQVRDGRRKR
jgi:DnaJ-class molecular chaperone